MCKKEHYMSLKNEVNLENAIVSTSKDMDARTPEKCITLNSNQRSDLLNQALSYAEQGIPVVGCTIGDKFGNGKLAKYPPMKGGFCKENLTLDPDKIRKMFSRADIVAIGTIPEECGFCIIDLDPKSDDQKRCNDELIDAIIKYGELPITLTVQTISNGRHMYYHGKSTKGGIRFFDESLPVDLLPHNNKSGVILPDRINYNILNLPEEVYNHIKDFMAPLPNWITTYQKSVKNKLKNSTEPQQQRTPKYSISEVEKYLSILEKSTNFADSYEKCVQVVGFGLHENFYGNDIGLELFHNFCSYSEKYESKWCDEKWESFGKNNHQQKVTFASVIAYAVNAQDESNKQRLKDYYYIGQQNMYWDSTIKGTVLDSMITPQSMRVIYGKSFSQALDSGCFSENYISQLKYEPGEGRIIVENDVRYINTYESPDIKKEEKEPTVFLRHMDYLFSNETEREHILNFFAHIVQHPRKKIRHALCIIGSQGIGKSYFERVFKKILGVSNITSPTNDAVGERHTAWAEHFQVCIINEIYQADKKHFADKFKPFITDETLEIRKMCQNPYHINNYMNIIAFSNFDAPLFLEENDRRWYVVKCDCKPKDEMHYALLTGELRVHPGRILNFLKNRDISSFNPNVAPPQTVAKKELTDQSKSVLESWLEEQIKEGNGVFEESYFKMETLANEVPKSIKFNWKTAANILRKNGFDNPVSKKPNPGRYWKKKV